LRPLLISAEIVVVSWGALIVLARTLPPGAAVDATFGVDDLAEGCVDENGGPSPRR